MSASSDKKENRVVILSGELNEEKSEKLITRFLELEAISPAEDIMFYIDSPGGCLDSLIAVYDTIQMVRPRVVTVCLGKAMSAACVLLLGGTPGCRFMSPHSRTMLHLIRGGIFGSTKDLDEEMQEVLRLQAMVQNIISDRTKIPPKKLEKILKSKSTAYFTAEESLEAGIVDHVVATNSDLYKRIKQA